MRIRGYIGLGFVCLFYWILDSVWSYLSFEYNLKKMIFSEPTSCLDTFILNVSPYQMVSRLMVLALFVILGGIILEFIIKRQGDEKNRRESHKTLLTILNSIDATIYVSDMQTHEILFMNQFMIDSFGGDFTGDICHEVFQNSTGVCKHCPNEKLLTESNDPRENVVWEGQNPITKSWYMNHDRAVKWVNGNMVHLQIAMDITQLKELQEKQNKADDQLRHLHKMEAIGNLAGGIAHDFNNILSSILGYTELSLDDVEKGTGMEDYLQEVYSAGKRAKDLVKQILTFARKSDEELKPLQINTIIREGVKFIKSTIPTTIEIKQDIVSDSLIVGNPTQIHQVLMNLLTNAAHAMEDEGGIMAISLKDVSFDQRTIGQHKGLAPGDYIELKVSDTGVGIPPEIAGSIFDPYFTTKGQGEGTGMGLAVVHGIVESHGGKITMDSPGGKGSVFTVYVPITKKRKNLLPHPPETLPTGTERILFVDDETAITTMGGKVLSHLGYSVETSTSSVQALERFRAGPDDFDLVITDMTMPEMTGDKMAIEMMAIQPDILVILCTGYSKKISEASALEIGIKAFVHKPILKADIAKTVRRVLDDA